jgi:nitric oxide reductase FlRd-NAD(+) reductase
MDFCRAGKSVTLVDHAASILSALMPAEVSSRLQHRLTDMGVHLLLKSQLQSLSKTRERHSRHARPSAQR